MISPGNNFGGFFNLVHVFIGKEYLVFKPIDVFAVPQFFNSFLVIGIVIICGKGGNIVEPFN